MFSAETQQQIDRVISRYPIRRNALLPVLHLAQKDKEGYLTPEVIHHIAELCEVTPTHVEGVITFYTMYKLKKPGKFHLQICTCVPCCLMGGPELLEHVEDHLGIHAGHTTDDGMFSIEEMECIGACSYAPAIIVNEDYHEQLTPEKMDQLIDQLRNQA
ncbi:MAG: NADH-quinone oxidoreductase subunit NuoE [bacterium]